MVQRQIKKEEIEKRNCTFKPEINENRSYEADKDNERKSKSRTKYSQSPDYLINVPGSSRVEDRLIEMGQRKQEKIVKHR